MGEFAGILIGALVGIHHNKYCDTEFKGVLSIYSGHRFVAILAKPSAMILGFLAAEFLAICPKRDYSHGRRDQEPWGRRFLDLWIP